MFFLITNVKPLNQNNSSCDENKRNVLVTCRQIKVICDLTTCEG